MKQEALFYNPAGQPERKDLIRSLLWARKEFRKNEDEFTERELAAARAQLPIEFETFSTFTLKNLFIRLRKDKLIRKQVGKKKLEDRFAKVMRTYAKEREARGFGHQSQEYKGYMQSDQWKQRRAEHIELCEYQCQLCAAETKLEVHHTPLGYHFLGAEETHHLMALCKRCHEAADFLRERG